MDFLVPGWGLRSYGAAILDWVVQGWCCFTVFSNCWMDLLPKGLSVKANFFKLNGLCIKLSALHFFPLWAMPALSQSAYGSSLPFFEREAEVFQSIVAIASSPPAMQIYYWHMYFCCGLENYLVPSLP